MPGESSPFHGDLGEEVRPSNDVDSMARLAWAAAGGGGGGGGGEGGGGEEDRDKKSFLEPPRGFHPGG